MLAEKLFRLSLDQIFGSRDANLFLLNFSENICFVIVSRCGPQKITIGCDYYRFVLCEDVGRKTSVYRSQMTLQTSSGRKAKTQGKPIICQSHIHSELGQKHYHENENGA